LLFEYNAKDPEDQAGIQAAGISFDTSGTYEIWNHDAEGKLRKATNQVDQKHGGGISLGRQEDKVVRMKNGFAIDYDQSKDTASTDAEGVRHAFKSRKRYHAELVWVGNH
ncbi:MAG TPA: hypothetical protein VN043_13625, partial [Rhodanobacter sp.]|nr:hypothetical protein [Rhodanobacter sp.]